tara:strand:+ start:24348 stop:25097 length:750 start_codon:yes stop_codon:yes gene_type:complete
MIASLMMYLRPELADANARYWALIRQALASRGIDAPETLSNDADEFEVWNAPDLVLSQTCGMPYRLWLHDHVTLVGTPDFGVPDCPAGYYNSVFIVRADDARRTLPYYETARFTYNQTFSQSGYAAPYAHTTKQGFWFRNRSQSGGHRASACAIAENRADIAALDAVSWRLIQQHESFAKTLRVLDTTPPTPGLPYIAATTANRADTFAAISDAIAALTPADTAALGIRALIDLPKADYLSIANPPQGA